MRYFGAHLPSFGDLDKALLNALSLKCNAMQIFLGGRISWRINLTSRFTIQNSVKKYAHAPYVINLANMESEEKLNRSIELTKSLLFRGEDLGLDGIVVHTGFIIKQDVDRDKALSIIQERVVADLGNFVLENKIKRCKLLLEPTSGSGSSIAYSPETVKSYFSIYPDTEDWWGVCIDTCHIYCAGLDLHDREKSREFFNSDLIEKKMSLLHLNNTADNIGSFKDRHKNLHNGKIKLDEFLNVIDCIDTDIPVILETPEQGRKEDMATLLPYRS